MITFLKIKNKERISKAAREKDTYLQRSAQKTISWFLKTDLISKKQEWAGKKYSKSFWKAMIYIQDYSTQQSFHLEWKGR